MDIITAALAASMSGGGGGGTGTDDYNELSNKPKINNVTIAGNKSLSDIGAADASETYTDAEVDALLADKADADDVYTKQQVDTELAKKPGEITTGKQYVIDGQTVTAGTGAEAFNRLSTNIASGPYSHAEGAQIYINSPPNDTVPIFKAGEDFMVAIMYKSSSYSDAMYKGGSDVVNAAENSLPNRRVTNMYLHVSPYDTQLGVGSNYPYGQSVDASTLTSGNYLLLAEGFNGSIYATMIADGEVIVRDLVPARRTSDNKVGMYDMVSHNFFTSAGSGEFAL